MGYMGLTTERHGARQTRTMHACPTRLAVDVAQRDAFVELVEDLRSRWSSRHDPALPRRGRAARRAYATASHAEAVVSDCGVVAA